MENITDIISKWSYGPKMPFSTTRSGVVGNPKLQAGILLFTSLLGLVTYIGVFRYQRRALSLLKRSFIMCFSCEHMKLQGAQNIHVSLFALIFIDVLNVIGAMIFGGELAASACLYGNTCQYTFELWVFSRWFEMIVHLLTAFISLLYLCQPHLGAKLRGVFSVVSLLLCVFYYSFRVYSRVALYMINAVTILLAMGITATLKVPPVSHSTATNKKLIVILAMCMFFVVFFPGFVFECLIDSQGPSEQYSIIALNFFFFTNFQVCLDGLLCCVILKLSAEEGVVEDEPQQWELQQQEQQQPPTTDLNYSSNTNAVTA